VVDRHPAFLHGFLDMAIAQRVRQRPPYTHEKDILRTMGAFEADHPCSPSLVQSELQRESIPEIVQE